MNIRNFIPRLYQEKILETSKEKNTLVVLPTGLGKTACAIMLAIDRLNKYPNSKVLVCSPTKPLCSQHIESFKKYTDIDENKILLLTGIILPKKREELWKDKDIIIATPQTIESDLKNKRISLENFSMLCIDEAHRSRQKFANTVVSKHYVENSKFPRILALTASPGSTKEKIEEIKNNLFIEAIEIRDETNEDVMPYLQKKNIEFIELELPESFKEIHKLVNEVYTGKIKQLSQFGLTKPISIINKRDLILFQTQLQSKIKHGNRAAFWGISITAQKLTYALELLETQGINQFYNFISKLENGESKAAKQIFNDNKIKNALKKAEILINSNIEHPKINALKEIIKKQLQDQPLSKIIIFANYRDTVKNIVENLKKIEGAKSTELLGQKEGITQKKQLESLKEFEEGKYNIIATTSIGEEGLDLKGGLNIAIFFDQAASAIRKIQRSGRVGRTEPGKIIYLITKGTRDQAYHWKSHRDIKKIKYIISKMQSRIEKQTKL